MEGEEKELRREENKKKWILMFFTYGGEEEEEKEEKGQRSLVYCEIRDFRLFIGVFYRWIIKLIFLIIPSVILFVIFNLNFQFNKFFSEIAKYHR
jgi:hypothetical protein